MTITLTNKGWTGSSNGVWTDRCDTVTDNIGGIVVNLGTTANTRAGNDSITGAGGVDNSEVRGLYLYFGIENLGEIIMGDGKDSITGTAIGIDKTYRVFGIYNESGGTIAMGNGNNNSITGMATGDGSDGNIPFPIAGIYNRSGTITLGNGNNGSITGIGTTTGGPYSEGIFNRQGGTIAMGDGNNDSITGIGGYYNGIYNRGTIKMGKGNNDSISGTGRSDGAYGIYNQSYSDDTGIYSPIITMGDGNNGSIAGTGIGNGAAGIYNDNVVRPGYIPGPITVTMGNGNNNSITGTGIGNGATGIYNGPVSTITLGDGNNDCITGMAKGSKGTGIDNEGAINMGNGRDILTGTGALVGIMNDGTINTKGGNDKVIANGGFGGKGSVFLETGDDYLKGFGSGTFDGGFGLDTLELTKGGYTVGISGKTVTFKQNDIIMATSGFEKLIAGCKTYSLMSLQNGQVINV